MPMIGGVYVPDDLAGPLPEAKRPTLGAIFGANLEGTLKQVAAALPYQFEVLTRDKVDEGIEQQYQEKLAAANTAFRRAAPASLDDATSGRVGIGRFVAENIVASLPQMGVAIAGGVAGGLAGGPGGAIAGATAASTPIFSASNVARAVEENGTLDVGAAERSAAFAPFQGAADAALLRFLPGAGRVLGDTAAAQTGGFIGRTAKSMAKAGATEAVTEAAQQFGERAAAGIELGSADAAAEYVNAAVTAFAVGGVFGAGGGFRRTNADAKAAELVTNEDMVAKIDGMLDGKLRASVPIVPRSNVARGPDGEQLALPSPEMDGRNPDGSIPDVALQDASGRTIITPNVQPSVDNTAAVLANLPRPATEPLDLGGVPDSFPGNFNPALRAALDGIAPPAAPLDASTAMSRGLQLPGDQVPVGVPTPPLAQPTELALPGEPAPVVELPEGSFRPFKGESLADIEAAVKDSKSAPQLKLAAEEELGRRAQEARGEAELTTEDFQTRVDELKSGLRGGFVQTLTATDPNDLAEKVYNQIFVEQDTRSNTTKFAQRLGILDDKMEPGPVAAQVEARRAEAAAQPAVPAAPAAPAAPQVTERITAPVAATLAQQTEVQDALKAAGIQRQSPALKGLKLETPADVFAALATDALPDTARGKNAAVTQVEKVAQKLGLITDDDARDITPKGRTVFLQSPGGAEATVTAATDQGFTRASAAQFERGSRAQLGDSPQTTFADFEEMAAYEAGKAWARDFVTNGDTKTAAQTTAIQARQANRTTGRAVDRESVTSRKLPPQVQQAQSANLLIDSADLASARDTDVAALRRMARNGATPMEVGQAIQNVQAGRSLFEEGPRQPFVASAPRPLVRGQPRFKEMNTRTEAGRALLRTETGDAVRIFELRNLVQFALFEKAINKARADRLNGMLDKGDIKAVERNMKNFIAEANFMGSTGVADSQFEQFIGDKDFMGALDHMVSFGPSAYHREIMKSVRSLAQQLQKQGVKLELKIVREGDIVPRTLLSSNTRALTVVKKVPAEATVYLKSVELGGAAGMNYQLAAHEMIHAVTMSLIQRGNTKGVYGNTKLGRAVEDLYGLQDAIAAHFNARADEGSLNEFEQAFFQRNNNSLANVDEILAWGLTNPEMQKYLASIEYKPRQSLLGRLVELLRNMLGLDVPYNSAMTELLRVSEQIMDVDAADLQSTFPRNNPDLVETGTLSAAAEDAGAANRTAQATNEVTQQIASMTDTVVNALTPDDFKVNVRKGMFGWMSHNQLDRMFGALMPGLLRHSDAHRERVAVRSRYEQMFDNAYQSFEKLERDNAPAAERVGKLMALTTEFQLDPDKAFDQHSHLGWIDGPNGTRVVAKGQEAEVARLAPLYDAAVKLKNDMRRGDGAAWNIFNDFRALNEAQNYSRMAAELHSLVATDRELSLGVEDSDINPVDQFMRVEGLATGTQIRDWWKAALDRQIAQVNTFSAEKIGSAARSGDASAIAATRQYLSPIELQVNAIYEARKAMTKSPYFHLGRFGNYFGSAVVAKREDGTADPQAMVKLAAALEKAGFADVQISTDNTRPRFMLRFETEAETQTFEKLMLKLQREGVISKDDEIKRGPRNSNQNFGVAEGLPESVASYIQAIETSPRFIADASASAEEKAALEKYKQDAIRTVLDTWLNQQPDSSISKVLVKRYTVPGFNKDMIRNYAHRWRVGSISLANVAAGPKFNRAFGDMLAQVNEAIVVSKDGKGGDPTLLGDLMREMRMRDATTPINDTGDTFDKLRAVSHAYFLGLSPAYGMINMTQLGVVALPELAKKHGYSKSFAAMRRSGAAAFKIMGAIFSEAQKLGPKSWADVAITEEVLRKAGLSADQVNFTLQMLATGTIDIGSSARALGQIAEDRVGSKLDVGLKYASAIGMYTETFSRLTTALAARDLNGGTIEEAAKYATQVVSDSMFDYQSWNTARQLGKRGLLGPITPIVTQFMSYSVQLTEKLYAEVMSAAGKPRIGESAELTAQRKKEAFRFLTGHLTAVTMLAGTLGLPFATVFAAALERIVDAFDDDEEPFDATASYRNFVSDVFGQQVGEVVARGLPRALGFDISARAGEQNLFPFSELIADQRPWREAVAANAGRSLGAVPSMITNVVSGGEKLAQGDLIGGMKEMMPIAFKAPIEVYRMTSDGYLDSKGNKLPLTPAASSYMWQLLGFSPAEKAEYGEARADQASRRGEISRRAQTLRRQIVKAMIDGDREKAGELISDAQQFDQDNPAFAVVPSLAGALQRQAMARSRATALQTPIGVGINDISGQRLTNYANVGFAQ